MVTPSEQPASFSLAGVDEFDLMYGADQPVETSSLHCWPSATCILARKEMLVNDVSRLRCDATGVTIHRVLSQDAFSQ
jgi:hypothetical protein